MSVLKRQKINEKEAGDGPFFKNLIACGNVVVARSRKYFFLQNFFAPRIIFYRLLHLKLPIFLESHNFAKTVYFFQNLLQAIQARGVSIMPIKKAQEDDDDDEPKKVGVLSLVRVPTKFSIVNNF